MKQVAASAFPNSKQKRIEHYSYNLNELLGQGFSSMVYKGRNELTKELVAVKLIDRKKITNEIEEGLLHQEIRALGLMQSPNCLKMYDHYHRPECTYIITELCNQGDLGQLIRNAGHIPEMEALQIFKHILNGFKEQIAKGIIHRDLKPINILLRNGVPKLADYGFSKMMNAPQEKVYYNVGTALYMSPQTMIKNMYSEKTDIWSLGVIYYEMLYGKVPFVAQNEKDLSQIICRDKPDFSGQNISKESIDFILRCLCVDESKRISCNDMEFHPIFNRRNTLVVARPTANHRTSSINHTKSPQRSSEYVQRQVVKSNGLVPQVPFVAKAISSEEIIGKQLQFIEFMLIMLKVIDKLEVFPFEMKLKLQFCICKNTLIKAVALQDHDHYKEKIKVVYDESKKCYERMQQQIEQSEPIKISLRNDKTFKAVYDNLAIDDTKEFYILVSNCVKRAIRELLNQCNSKSWNSTLSLQEEGTLYLLEQLLNYYILIKVIIDSHNNINTFTKKFALKQSKNLQLSDLEGLRKCVQELKI